VCCTDRPGEEGWIYGKLSLGPVRVKPEPLEIIQSRREVARLRVERDILKKPQTTVPRVRA
jgi:transposase-like protein